MDDFEFWFTRNKINPIHLISCRTAWRVSQEKMQKEVDHWREKACQIDHEWEKQQDRRERNLREMLPNDSMLEEI